MKGHNSQWLLVGKLKIDDSYQRPISSNKVKGIRKCFDIDKLGVLMVSHRDGCYWVMDGQHRLAAAIHYGLTHVPCCIYEGLSRAREAELRLGFNTRKAESAVERFRLFLAMGNPEAIHIKQIIESAGLALNLSGTGGTYPNPRQIRSVGLVERIYLGYKGGPNLLARTLRISMAAWPDDYKGRTGAILSGLALFLAKYPEVPEAELVSKLQGCTPASLLARIKDEWLGILGYSQDSAIARLIWRVYNYKKRCHQLPNRFVETP